jgi:hypothetical protein
VRTLTYLIAMSLDGFVAGRRTRVRSWASRTRRTGGSTP